MKSKQTLEIAEVGRYVFNRIIRKIGIDTGCIVAVISEREKWSLNKARYLIRDKLCVVYDFVVNQAIYVLKDKKGYSLEKAKGKVLRFLEENGIKIVSEKEFNVEIRDSIYQELLKRRNKLKVKPKPQDDDLDILASYKVMNVDCIITTNFMHFIEFGKYLNIFIEAIRTERNKKERKVDRMLRDNVFWGKR